MCIFTEDFLKAGSRMEALRQSTLFRPGSDKVFFLDKAQLEAVKKIYEDMLAELAGDYIYRYDILRNYVNATTRIATLFLELQERQFPIVSPDRELKLKRANDFAKCLSVHVNHLNHAVREVTGKSTSIHIAERIINEAKALLKHTDWSVSAIAFSLGFEYPTYFNNFFKKNTGVTPSSMRE